MANAIRGRIRDVWITELTAFYNSYPTEPSTSTRSPATAANAKTVGLSHRSSILPAIQRLVHSPRSRPGSSLSASKRCHTSTLPAIHKAVRDMTTPIKNESARVERRPAPELRWFTKASGGPPRAAAVLMMPEATPPENWVIFVALKLGPIKLATEATIMRIPRKRARELSGTTASSATPITVPGNLPPVIQANAGKFSERRSLRAIRLVIGRARHSRVTGTASGRRRARVGTAISEKPKPMEPCITAPANTARRARGISVVILANLYHGCPDPVPYQLTLGPLGDCAHHECAVSGC